MNLSERILTIIREQGLTNASLGRAIGVTKTGVGLWVNGTTRDIDFKRAEVIGKKYGYNPEWIAYGRLPKYPVRSAVSPEMREIIDMLIALDMEGGERRDDVIYFIHRLLPKNVTEKTG